MSSDLPIRLQKILVDHSVCSRREAEDKIRSGEITINGKIAKLGDKAIAGKDHIKINGKLLQVKKLITDTIIVAFFKPRDVLSQPASKDSEGRARSLDSVEDLLPRGVKVRLLPVGRLDTDAEGMLFLTNDGELSQRLNKAKYEVPKVYSVKIDGTLDDKRLKRLEAGMKIEEKRIKPTWVKVKKSTDGKSWIEICITDPRNRVVRKLFESVGRPVDKVCRENFAGISLRGLERGAYRVLNDEEVLRIKQMVGLAT